MKMIAELLVAALTLGMAFAQSTTGSQGTTVTPEPSTPKPLYKPKYTPAPRPREPQGSPSNPGGVPVASENQLRNQAWISGAGKHSQGSTGTGNPTPQHTTQGKKPLAHTSGGGAPVGHSGAKLPIKPPPIPSANQGSSSSSSTNKKPSTKRSAPSSPGGPPTATGPNSPGVANFVQHMGQAPPALFGEGHRGNKRGKKCDAGPGCGPSPGPQKQ